MYEAYKFIYTTMSNEYTLARVTYLYQDFFSSLSRSLAPAEVSARLPEAVVHAPVRLEDKPPDGNDGYAKRLFVASSRGIC